MRFNDLVELGGDLNPAIAHRLESLGFVLAGKSEAVHDALRRGDLSALI